MKLLVAPLLALALFFAAGCDRSKPSEPAPAAPASTATTAAVKPHFPPAPARIVAIGDLHGDLDATKRVLRLAGATDAKGAWIGGKLLVVQTGDEIDRGDGDRAILDLFEALKADAAKAGGEVVAMLGNHEVMNASFDFRYVTPGAYTSFADVKPKNDGVAAALDHLTPPSRGRAAAFAPGGAYATMLAKRPVIYGSGDTVFVHGGVLPKHVTYGIDRINADARGYFLGEKSDPPRLLTSEDGPLWTRMYSAAPGREECAMVNDALAALGVKRMVMGHTVQRNGINPACDGKAWRIDVGMSKIYEGPIQALQIDGDVVTVLKETSAPAAASASSASRDAGAPNPLKD
jgi:hypothetical protein